MPQFSAIAITGGIAEGKTTVCRYLAAAGATTVSADELARKVFQEAEVQRELASLLGAEPDRDVVREALGKPDLRRAINRVTHPRILLALAEARADFIEIPLLLETCLQDQFKAVWVVTCGREEQLRRLTARSGSEATAKSLIETQLSSRAKIPFADVLVRTNFPEPHVQRFVSAALVQEKR